MKVHFSTGYFLKATRVFLSVLFFGIFLLYPVSTSQAVSNPFQKADNSWITLNGEVLKVRSDEFDLKFDSGVITVEMDDGDRDADAYKLVQGDSVTVTGKVDDGLFENTTIEASTVYVENIGTLFYSSAIDEEDLDYVYQIPTTTPPMSVSLIGVVKSVDEQKKQFTLKSGERAVTVDTEDMVYNPLDDVGYLKIGKGDIVTVTGRLEKELLSKRVLTANRIVNYSHKAPKAPLKP